MSDSLAMGAVVFVTLALLSFMLVARLRAGGAPGRRISVLIAELWLSVGVVAVIFIAVANLLGPPRESGSLGADLADVGHRFLALSGESKGLAVAGAVVALGLFGRLLWAIGRAMQEAPPS